MNKKIIILLLLSFLFPEQFIYSLGFRFINVGHATISSETNSENELVINTLVASNKFLDRLYKVRDEIKLIVTMKKASRLMVIGSTNKGDQTTDHYSMMGFTKAYNTAKKSCS